MTEQSAPDPTAPTSPRSKRAGFKRAGFIRNILRYVISASILAGGIAVCYSLSLLKEQPREQSAQQLIPLVSVDSVIPYSGQIDMLVAGTVVPFREINVAAKVTGNVIKKSEQCEAGNYVTVGTPLIEIDPADYTNQLETAAAELSQAKTSLAEHLAEVGAAGDSLKLAKRDMAIAKDEFDRSQRIRQALSRAEFDQAKRDMLNSETQFTTRQNNLMLMQSRTERMQAAVSLSQTRVQAAQTSLDRATVVAPDDGIIVSETVQEGDFVTVGSPLFTFEDTRKSEVICNLSPRDLAWIRTNSSLDDELKQDLETNPSLAAYYLPRADVELFEPDNQTVVWRGKLERFDGIGRDNATRTIPTRISVDDPVVNSDGTPQALVRGMFVKCQIKVQISAGDPDKRFLSFPAVALRPGGYVWTVVDNKLQKVLVDVVDRTSVRFNDDTRNVIVIRHTTDSLQPNDTLVVSPISQATEGMQVETDADSDSARKRVSLDRKDSAS